MASYAEQLRDPRWQRRRLEVLERDEWACVDCGDATSELHVHHLRYTTGNKPWDYDLDDLRTLCRKCHDETTQITRAAREIFYTLMAQDAQTSYELLDANNSLMTFSFEVAETVIEASHQLARAAMNGVKFEAFIVPFVRCLHEITDLAKEAERGKNQDA